jgi:hypothetical protein
LPDAEEAWSKLVVIDTSNQDIPALEKEEIRSKVLQLGTIRPKGEGFEVGSKLEVKKDQGRVAKTVLMSFPAPLNASFRGEIVVGCLDSALIARLHELKSAPWNPKQPLQTDNSPSLLQSYKPDWYIVQVIVHPGKVEAPDASKPGAPPGRPMGP